MNETATRSERFDARFDRLAMLVLAACAIVVLATFRDYGMGWDDFTHSQYGALLLKLYTSGFADREALHFVNLYHYGGGFDMAAALLAKALPFDLFETRRLVGGLAGLVGLLIVWRLARRTGGPAAGFFALVLLATCPLFVGHMFINPKDGPFAVAMALMLYGIARVIEDYPRPRLAATGLFGLGLGLAFGTRILAGFGAIAALAAFSLIVAVEARAGGVHAALARAGRFIISLVPALVIGYAVMALVWPWAVADPLNPLRALEYFAHFFEKPWRELFDGQLIRVPDMPRSYVPTLFAFKLPEVFLALGLAGAAGALIAMARREVPRRRRAVLLAIVLVALLPVAVTVATRPAMYNGIRHFVFVLPPLAVLGGLAASWLIDKLRALARPLGALAALAIIAAAVPPVIDMARLHPYEYTSFNHLAGGVRGAEGRFMLDYWGLSFKQAALALRHELAERQQKPPAGRKWRIAVCGPHPPAAVALGPDFDLTWDPLGADFALTLGVFYCARLPAPVLADIRREGVLYARAYDLRGRSVSRLMTLPPP
jgi:hypothetical protein